MAHVMENNEINKWRRWELAVNVLLVAVVLVTIANVAWGLQTSADRRMGTAKHAADSVLLCPQR